MVLAQSGHAVGKFSNISVVAKDAALNEQGRSPTGVEAQPQARAAHCATITGSLLGAIGGCLVGMGILAVPTVPVLAVGTSETAVVITLTGAGIGLASGGLISALAVSRTLED
jgi:hypothetical protein